MFVFVFVVMLFVLCVCGTAAEAVYERPWDMTRCSVKGDIIVILCCECADVLPLGSALAPLEPLGNVVGVVSFGCGAGLRCCSSRSRAALRTVSGSSAGLYMCV